ncbi:hypothetical protein [Comamonas sp. E6]|uniref:hypothetical protein n=1 Tax=Comamonas sp. E6 TaxID=364029 RepID=UPI001930FBA8|nr:hypothetical protein [Comamonas sp. E6]
MNLDILGLQINSPLAHPEAKNFRPPSWPPPSDWAPIVDAQGMAQCVYADSCWPLDVWAGSPLKINFGDGKKNRGVHISPANADLLRQCATWFMWGSRGCRTPTSFAFKVTTLKPLFAVCTREGIVATDLMRFESIIDQIATSLAPSQFDNAITLLHELFDARKELGFYLLNPDGLARLAKLAPQHEAKQTPYIPPRIWTYQLSRLRECLEEYVNHAIRIEECFEFCLDAYAHNFGSLKQAINTKRQPGTSPFNSNNPSGDLKYLGSFKLTTDRFGVTELFERWVGPLKGKKQITRFSQYLDLVSMAGLAYLLNFSLMRIEEGWNLRSDCLQVEKDEKFGEIHILCGETTKTDPDSDARWPVSKSASLAIDVMKHIAALRMRCAKEHGNIGVTLGDENNPYLISYQYEPWSKGKHRSYRTRPSQRPYQQCLNAYPQLFDPTQITINEEDFRIARLITPSLDTAKFKSGHPWQFAWHQLRRTGAINMLSSDMVDESSLQVLLKHLSRVMTLYYGRNHSRLALSEETRILFLKTMYQEIGRDLRKLPSPQFTSLLGPRRKEVVIAFITENDAISLETAARQGKVGARRIRAGFCVNHRSCSYGGIEAIAHCLGGDDDKGCPDLLLDIGKEADIRIYEKVVDTQLKIAHPNSPRHRSLQAEKRAIGKFYEVVQAQNR